MNQKISCATMLILALLPMAWAQDAIEGETAQSFGEGIGGTFADGTYFIESGTLTGDLTGKNVVIEGGKQKDTITLGKGMVGTVQIKDAAIRLLPPPSERVVKGSGTCNNGECTFIGAETGDGNQKISNGFFAVDPEGNMFLSQATIGERENVIHVSNIGKYRNVDGKIAGEAVGNTEIGGNAISNQATFDFDPVTKELRIGKPENSRGDYEIGVSRFIEGTTIIGENIRFEDTNMIIHALEKGSVKKISERHFQFGEDSQWADYLVNVYSAKNQIHYVSDSRIPNDLEGDFIKSDVHDRGIRTLSINSRHNDIQVDLTPSVESYQVVSFDNLGGAIKVQLDGNSIHVGTDGSLAVESLAGLESIFRSTVGGRQDYITPTRVGFCDNDCMDVLLDVYSDKLFRASDLGDLTFENAKSRINSRDSDDRILAARTLRSFDTPEAKDLLSSLLKTETDDLVLEQAIRSLGFSGDTSTVPFLLEYLNDDNELLVSAAAASIGRLMESSATPELVGKLQSAQTMKAKISIIIALGDLNDPAAINPIIGTFDSLDQVGKMLSATALGKLQNEETLAFLFHRLGTEEGKVREAIASSLNRFVLDEKATPDLLAYLESDDFEIRTIAQNFQAVARRAADEEFASRIAYGVYLSKSDKLAGWGNSPYSVFLKHLEATIVSLQESNTR